MQGRARLTRRQFVKASVGASVGSLAAPLFLRSSALGEGDAVSPSNRLTLGLIGAGGRGMWLLRAFLRQPDVQVVAACDVDRERDGGQHGRMAAKRVTEKFYAQRAGVGRYHGCRVYTDFRELLARDDIDAVCIATPDHWHGLIAVAAADAKKDMYCEKPLTNSIGEGRAVCEAVKRTARVVQVGSHERSNPRTRFACELVRNGRIGKLHTIRINLPCSDPHHKRARALKTVPPPEPVPPGFDYDFWLGHTPKVPYTPKRCHFWWRFILSYGGGEMTDRGAHIIDLAQLGNGTDDTGPVEIVAQGVQTPGSLYDTFWDYRFENRYANGVRLVGSTDQPRGLKFEGEEGWVFIHIHGGRLEANPASLLKEEIRADEIHLGRAPGNNHQRSFLEAVKTRGEPTAPVEAGHRTASICHLNNLAMLLRRTLKWDPHNEQVVGDPEANALLMPKMRPPWHL